MPGENDDILDLSFEDLSFIGEPDAEEASEEGKETTEEVDDKGVNPNEPTAEEQQKIDDDAAAAAKELGDDDAEGANPEGVGIGSTDDSKGGGKETSPQLYQTLAEVLREKGVLSSVDESSFKDIKDIDAFVELMKSQIAAEEFADLDDTQKTILKDMRDGVSTESAEMYKNSMDQLNALDDNTIEEDKQVRFDLIYQDFVSKGFDKAKASKYANRSFELKEDLVDAREAKANLISSVEARYEAAKQKDITTATTQKEKIANNKEALKKQILENKEVLKNIEATEKVRKEVYEEMSKTVSTNPETGVPENALMKHQRENPVEFSHKLYYLYKVTNGFKDVEYFKGKKTSDSTKKLENALRHSTHVAGGGDPSFADDGQSHSLDIGELVLPD